MCPVHLQRAAPCLSVHPKRGDRVLDLQAFVASLKDHVLEHGFHIEDERHYIETYSGEQVWNIGLHPENGCDRPISVELSVTVSTRALIAFEDALSEPEGTDVNEAPDGEASAQAVIPLTVEVSAAPLTTAPDLLVLATEVAAQSHSDVPLSPTLSSKVEPLDDGEQYCLHVSGEVWLPLLAVYQMDDLDDVCAALDSARSVCEHLADHVDKWMD